MEFLILAVLVCLAAQFFFGLLKWVFRAAIVALVLWIGLLALAERSGPATGSPFAEGTADEPSTHSPASERAGRAVGEAIDRAADGARRAADEAGGFARGVMGR